MPNPATMNSLQSFEREHVNIVIHVPDYKLRRQISLQEKESLVVEAFSAFEEMFYLHLRWAEGSKYPDFSLTVMAAQKHRMVLELNIQSPYFTYVSSDVTYSASTPQWTTCNWSTAPTPIEIHRSNTTIPLSVDRPPTQHNDGNISFEQTMTIAIVGTLWKLDDCPTDALRCFSYRGRIRDAAEPQSAGFLPRMIANIAAMKAPGNNVGAGQRSDTLLEIAVDGTNCDISADADERRGGADADVEIRLDDEGQVFTVHSFVLKAHSPVFRRMLDGSMAEAFEGVVNMKNVSASELDDLLACLYELSVPKEVQEDEGRLMSLLALADRYEVLALRDECACLLALRLSESNMAAILKIADMHQASELKASALAFIACRPERLIVAMDTDDVGLRKSVREYLSREAAKPMTREPTRTLQDHQRPMAREYASHAAQATSVPISRSNTEQQ